MEFHQQVALGFSCFALVLTLFNIWHTRSIKRSEWLIAAVNAAAETVSIADDTIRLADDAKPTIQAAFHLAGAGQGSREKIYLDEVETYKNSANEHREYATSRLEALTSRWKPKLSLVRDITQLSKAKHQMGSVRSALLRLQTDFASQQDKWEQRRFSDLLSQSRD